MGENEIETVTAYLCPGCAEILDGFPLKVEPTGESAEDAQECPWCQKKRAFSKYRIRTNPKKA